MNYEQLVKCYVNNPVRMRESAFRVEREYHVAKELVPQAREEARNILREMGLSTSTDTKRRDRQNNNVPQGYKKEENRKKILLLDTETTPMQAYIWDLWKQNIPWERVTSQWFFICWSAKWLYDEKVYSDCLTPEEIVAEDDSRICRSLRDLLDQADIVIAHNAKGADIPWINTRLLLNGLKPPTPYFVVDTLEIARTKFGFSSNKLDALAGYLGISHKLETDFNLWRGCLEGSQAALDYMTAYNRKDVEILEEVFIKLAPWAKNLPNANNILESEVPVCATCGSRNIKQLPNKWYYTSIGKYPLYECQDCGAHSRGRYSVYKEKYIKIVGVNK